MRALFGDVARDVVDSFCEESESTQTWTKDRQKERERAPFHSICLTLPSFAKHYCCCQRPDFPLVSCDDGFLAFVLVDRY